MSKFSYKDTKKRISDFNKRLPENKRPSIKQNQSIDSVKNNNPENQVNAFNVENIDTFDKAKANTKNQISHSTFCDYSNASHDFNDLNISVNENTSTYKKSLPDKAQHLRSVQSINSEIHDDVPAVLKKNVTREISKGWNVAFNDLNNLIKIKHYSPKTLRAYTNWIRKFQGFTRNKDIHSLSSLDVKGFLEYLAVVRMVKEKKIERFLFLKVFSRN